MNYHGRPCDVAAAISNQSLLKPLIRVAKKVHEAPSVLAGPEEETSMANLL
jgi:hypothetical protein